MTTLYYIHDPMCSWCWGFSRVWQQTLKALPADIQVIRLLGGLAPDTNDPMNPEMQEQLQNTWRRIKQQIPGVEFNFDFWRDCSPRRATYPACRAVIAARKQGDKYDAAMTRAIQHAYYLQARNPSENHTLIALANELGLDRNRFATSLTSAQTHEELLQEISKARQMGADSFPGLVLQYGSGHWHIPVDYNHCEPMLEMIQLIMKE